MPGSQRIMVVAGSALLGSVLLVGCSAFVPSAAPAPSGPCGWMSQPTASTATGHTVVLIDRSNSTRSGRGRKEPDYPGGLADTIDSVMTAHDAISIGAFDGTASTIDWVARNLRTDRGRSDQSNRNRDDAAARTCIQADLARAAAQPADSTGTDVLGAVGAGVDELAPVTGSRRLVLATDGLSTIGCADLSHVGIGVGSEVDAVANLCQQRGELPRVPDQVSVTFLGIGYPAASQPQPTSTQLGWLRQLWTTLCTRMHDQHAPVGACDVVPTAPPATPSGNRTPTAGISDPAITFPAADAGIQTQDGAVVYPLGDVLFDTGKADLTGTGLASVKTIATQIRQRTGATAAVNGYTDARGSVPYNQDLSQSRADTVRAALITDGVVVTSSVGHGEAEPVCMPQYRADGSADEQTMQCDRRVEVVVTTPRQ